MCSLLEGRGCPFCDGKTREGGGWGAGAGGGTRKEGKCSLEEEESLGVVRKDNTPQGF